MTREIESSEPNIDPTQARISELKELVRYIKEGPISAGEDYKGDMLKIIEAELETLEPKPEEQEPVATSEPSRLDEPDLERLLSQIRSLEEQERLRTAEALKLENVVKVLGVRPDAILEKEQVEEEILYTKGMIASFERLLDQIETSEYSYPDKRIKQQKIDEMKAEIERFTQKLKSLEEK